MKKIYIKCWWLHKQAVGEIFNWRPLLFGFVCVYGIMIYDSNNLEKIAGTMTLPSNLEHL